MRAGLKFLAEVGDFADEVIVYSGRELGSEQLATFDSESARLLSVAGEPMVLLLVGRHHIPTDVRNPENS